MMFRVAEPVPQQCDNVFRCDRSHEDLVGLRKKGRNRFLQRWIIAHEDSDGVRMKVPHCVDQCESVAGGRNVKITNQRGELLGGEKNYGCFNSGCRNHFETVPFECSIQSTWS